ncbi:MAG: nucleotidyltransferase, partial [Peptococcaceae bacterium]|nr:nucleotidyltransferase [Peptococcaceae bacterium]
RLRPLTCNRPKPMVPVLNRPMMAYIVELLKMHGIDDVAVTLQYLPEAIRDCFGNGSEFGVSMRYFVEEVPLGTAGSVKNASSFLDDTFLVISGDALTDFDLSRAVEFHRERGALATLVLTRVETPLEYGVVITNPDGSIAQFLEKPSWGEVFSDTVNTGIYILEPEVLEYVKKGQMFDFSKDLFPLLLREGRPLFGMVAEGYWCDIGNLQQYLQAHIDFLSGRVRMQIPGREIADNVFAGEGVEIDPSAVVRGPVFIGDGCKIGGGARIDSFSVLGSHCIVGGRATVKRSVLWNGVYVGRGSALRGAILGSRVQVQDGAGVYEGAVVGSDSVIRENGVVKPDVKIWPHKEVEAGATVHSSIVWGTRCPKKIFGLDGVTGLANVEMTPEFAARMAASFAAVTGGNARLAVSSDSCPASQMIKEAAASGMQSVGAAVYDLGEGITPMHRFAVRDLELDGGVHVKACPRKTGQVTMVFVNKNGGNISRGSERKVENVLMREDFKRADSSRIVPVEMVRGMADRYNEHLSLAAGGDARQWGGTRLVMAFDSRNLDGFVAPVCDRLGIRFTNIGRDVSGGAAGSWQAYRELLPRLAEAVVKGGATAGALIDPNGDSLILVDERGRVIGDDMLTALSALVLLKTGGGPVVVPVTAPETIEKMAGRYGGKVIRTKTAVQDFVERILAEEGDRGREGISQFLMHFDALGALLSIIGFARRRGLTLGQLADEIPVFYMEKKTVPVPWEAKGTVIRKIIEDPGRSRMELLDGVKVFHPNGWALVLPDPEEPVCRVFSEGASMEIAESLADFYIERISRIVGSRG